MVSTSVIEVFAKIFLYSVYILILNMLLPFLLQISDQQLSLVVHDVVVYFFVSS